MMIMETELELPVKVKFTPERGYPQTHDEPGMPASAEISAINILGLDLTGAQMDKFFELVGMDVVEGLCLDHADDIKNDF